MEAELAGIPGDRARRWLPAVTLATLAAAALGLGLPGALSFESLRENRAILAAAVAEHRVLAALIYVAAYAACVAVSIPVSLVLTVAGGFLFGVALGAPLAVVGATAGATILYLIARTALGDRMRGRGSGVAARLAEGFRTDALSYLLVLRLVPLFPFFAVNLACAILGVRLRTFVVGTALGIVPASVVYTGVGAGLGSVFDRGESFTPAGILTPEVLGALLGLAALALAPALYRRVRAAPRQDAPPG